MFTFLYPNKEERKGFAKQKPNPVPSAIGTPILAFFRARSINNRTSHEENTNLDAPMAEGSTVIGTPILAFFFV